MCDQEKDEGGKVLEVGNHMKETLEEWRGKGDGAGEERYAQFGDDGEEYEGEGGSVELRSAPYNCGIPISMSGVVGMSVGRANPSVSFYRYLYSSIGLLRREARKGKEKKEGIVCCFSFLFTFPPRSDKRLELSIWDV